MAQPRRMAVDGARQRELLIDAAEALLAEEGNAAISARRVTSKAGLKSQLLYYYFETMDELILAVVRRIADRRLRRFEEALSAPDPLQAIWALSSDPAVTTLSSELIAIAGRRAAIRDEILRAAGEFRALQTEAVTRLLADKGVDLAAYPPAGLVLIASAVARTISSEAAFGLTDGHKDALLIIERAVARYGAGADPGHVSAD